MESVNTLNKYPWYTPAHITKWQRQQDGDAATELIVMNHPEALVEQEQVDMEFLMSLVDKPTTVVDVVDSLKMIQTTTAKTNSSMDLIDKFLELKDLRIVPPKDDEPEVSDLMWEAADTNQPFTTEDDIASEELARIYLNQKLYKEANDIYNRLFLLYSEKSVYFATQILNIGKILEKESDNCDN